MSITPKDLALRNAVYSYITHSNLQEAYMTLGRHRRALKIERKIKKISTLSGVEPFTFYSRILASGSLNARLNGAKDCLELNILTEQASLVLNEIARNEDVEVLSRKAKEILALDNLF